MTNLISFIALFFVSYNGADTTIATTPQIVDCNMVYNWNDETGSETTPRDTFIIFKINVADFQTEDSHTEFEKDGKEIAVQTMSSKDGSNQKIEVKDGIVTAVMFEPETPETIGTTYFKQ